MKLKLVWGMKQNNIVTDLFWEIMSSHWIAQTIHRTMSDSAATYKYAAWKRPLLDRRLSAFYARTVYNFPHVYRYIYVYLFMYQAWNVNSDWGLLAPSDVVFSLQGSPLTVRSISRCFRAIRARVATLAQTHAHTCVYTHIWTIIPASTPNNWSEKPYRNTLGSIGIPWDL